MMVYIRMSYATDPAYLKLVEESRAYRARPNVKAANNAARAREGMFRQNFFNRTGRYPTVNELINMSVQAEMANLVGVRQELNPNVAAVLGSHDVHEHNYNANIAKWKAGVANRSINVRARPRQNIFSQKVNLNNRRHEPKSWAVNAQKEAEASNALQARRKALSGERIFPVLPTFDYPEQKVNQIVIPTSLRTPSTVNNIRTNEEVEWAAAYPAREAARLEANRAAYEYAHSPKGRYEAEKREYQRWLNAYNREPKAYTWYYPKGIKTSLKSYYEKSLRMLASAAGENIPPGFIRNMPEPDPIEYKPVPRHPFPGQKKARTRKNRR